MAATGVGGVGVGAGTTLNEADPEMLFLLSVSVSVCWAPSSVAGNTSQIRAVPLVTGMGVLLTGVTGVVEPGGPCKSAVPGAMLSVGLPE